MRYCNGLFLFMMLTVQLHIDLINVYLYIVRCVCLVYILAQLTKTQRISLYTYMYCIQCMRIMYIYIAYIIIQVYHTIYQNHAYCTCQSFLLQYIFIKTLVINKIFQLDIIMCVSTDIHIYSSFRIAIFLLSIYINYVCFRFCSASGTSAVAIDNKIEQAMVSTDISLPTQLNSILNTKLQSGLALLGGDLRRKHKRALKRPIDQLGKEKCITLYKKTSTLFVDQCHIEICYEMVYLKRLYQACIYFE